VPTKWASGRNALQEKDEKRTEATIWVERLINTRQKGKAKRERNGSQVNWEEQIESFIHIE
jgi:hypothetical protein